MSVGRESLGQCDWGFSSGDIYIYILSPSHTDIKSHSGPSTDAHPRGEMELFLVSGIGPRWEKWVTCNTPLTFLSPDHQFMTYLSP